METAHQHLPQRFLRLSVVDFDVSPEGPVINYGEVGGGGGKKWENPKSQIVCTPSSPSRRGTTFCAPF